MGGFVIFATAVIVAVWFMLSFAVWAESPLGESFFAPTIKIIRNLMNTFKKKPHVFIPFDYMNSNGAHRIISIDETREGYQIKLVGNSSGKIHITDVKDLSLFIRPHVEPRRLRNAEISEKICTSVEENGIVFHEEFETDLQDIQAELDDFDKRLYPPKIKAQMLGGEMSFDKPQDFAAFALKCVRETS